MINLLGENHVAIGADFDGVASGLADLPDISNLPVLAQAMLLHGYSQERVKKIALENVRRVVEAVLV